MHHLRLPYEIRSSGTAMPAQAIIACGCGREGSFPVVGNHNPEMVIKRFRRAGWDCSHRSATATCPDCVNRRTRKPPPTAPAPPPAAEPEPAMVPERSDPTPPHETKSPREASPDEKRRIRTKLDGTFDDAIGAYLDGYTDQRIGDELSIPWALVRAVREAAYGPIRADAEIDMLRRDLTTVTTELADLTRRVPEMTARLEAAERRLGLRRATA